MEFLTEDGLTWRRLGPTLAGAVFGAAWWIWVDAVVCNKDTVDFVHYIPGICATAAGFMFNVVRREDLQEYSPFDEGAGCRARTWLFLAYVIAFGSIASAAGFLVADSADKTGSAWPGVAGVFQCVFVIASGLIFWTSRSESDSSYY